MTKRIILNGKGGVIQGHTQQEIHVYSTDTPNGVSYRYKIGPYRSENGYVNSQSAWFDARRPQVITENGELIPDRPI